MKFLHQLGAWLLILLMFASCTDRDNSYLVPNITGKSNEVIVVMPKDTWDGAIGDTLFSVLSAEIPALPQPEPYFDVSSVTPANFRSLQSIQTFRNLVFTDVDTAYRQADILVKESKWARQQLVLTLRAHDKAQLIDLIGKQAKKIRERILQAEQERILGNYQRYVDYDIVERLFSKYKLALTVPKNYKLSRETSNFLWLSHETPEISQGIFVYWYPYTNINQLQRDSLVIRRNQFTKEFVPGAIPKSYMTTETRAPLFIEEMELSKRYTVQIKGLWRSEGDFMGGPFVSYTTVDEANQRIVTVEGFVYAPKSGKRNYVMQLDQILRTLRFDTKKENK